jgi:hypothetical protein
LQGSSKETSINGLLSEDSGGSGKFDVSIPRKSYGRLVMSYDYRRTNELFIKVQAIVAEWIANTPQEPASYGVKAPPSYVYREVGDYLHFIGQDMERDEKEGE